jgi:hypothetical protein
MGKKTDGAGRRLQRIIARLKRQEEELPPDVIEMTEREMDALGISELMEFGRRRPLTPAIEKAAQEFGLDAKKQAHRDLMLEYFAEAHYGKRERGRPTAIDGYDIFQDMSGLGHLEYVERLEPRGKTRAVIIAKDLREKLPERYMQIGEKALRLRVTKLLKEYEVLKPLLLLPLKDYEALKPLLEECEKALGIK